MPAYRSSAEAEVRAAVVARLREIRPQARIMHEVNCACFGPNRIDVIAVSSAEIISVEIKSAKDKIDRLPAQIASMKAMSHHVVAALHEKFLVEKESNQWSAHYEREGKFWIRRAPPEASGAKLWVYPNIRRAQNDEYARFDETSSWRAPDAPVMRATPGAIDMLWADEMRLFCRLNGVSVTHRSSRKSMLPLIRWLCTGEQITKGVCAILRQRECVEADAPIEMKVSA